MREFHDVSIHLWFFFAKEITKQIWIKHEHCPLTLISLTKVILKNLADLGISESLFLLDSKTVDQQNFP